MNCVGVVDKIVDLAKKMGNKYLIYKIDFEKAPDSVDWDFLDYMLGKFGFNEK